MNQFYLVKMKSYYMNGSSFFFLLEGSNLDDTIQIRVTQTIYKVIKLFSIH